MNAVRLAASVLALAYAPRTATAVLIPLPEMEDVDQQGGCCYNYYKEHKCICVNEKYADGKPGKYPTECKAKEGTHGPGTWVKEGTHGVNCTGRPGSLKGQIDPAPYWTKAKVELKLETKCENSPFCQDFAVSHGSCYDGSSDPSSGHVVVCNIKREDCIGGAMGANEAAGDRVNSDRYSWFPPGYAMKDRDGVRTCCQCNAGCDHSTENKALSCESTVGYRDVTTPDCNRKDGVVDNADGGHSDLSDYTIGRKKCMIPAGVSADKGVFRHDNSPAGTTATKDAAATVNMAGRSSLAPHLVLLVAARSFFAGL
jgi:hypothetical protein